MKQIKLVASDLDGTLLLNDAQFPSEEALHLIHALHEKGILFMASSGREYQNLQLIFAPVKDEIIYLCQNGCQAYYKGQRLAVETMDASLADEIVRDIEKTPGLEVELCGLKHVWIHPKHESYAELLTNVSHVEYERCDNLHAVDDEITKVSIYKADGFRPEDKTPWVKKYGDACNIQISGSCWCDFVRKDVDKGSCFEKLLKRFQIEPDETVVFGDNDNDLGILSVTGMPVAVDTAIPAVKKIAKRTTDTVEHALQKILDGTF